jgi:inhibitor of KinA sporulation pathway (predicted exonuclease)
MLSELRLKKMSKLHTVIVVDIEATCWRTDEERGTQVNEIIEIGACALDIKSGVIVERASIIVKPRFSTVSEFCTELTGWTQADVDTGLDIAGAFREFTMIFTPKKGTSWFSYGEYDRVKLSSCTGKNGVYPMYNIPAQINPFDRMHSHFNVKTLMMLKNRNPKEMGMAAALEYYGIPMEGRHHNGLSDAKIVKRVLE